MSTIVSLDSIISTHLAAELERAGFPEKSVTKISQSRFGASNGPIRPVSDFSVKVLTYSFGLKKIRGKNIASEKSCGFLLWETSVDMGGSSFKNATSTQLQNQFIGRYSNITWSLPLIISHLIVLWVPTWWRNRDELLIRQ